MTAPISGFTLNGWSPAPLSTPLPIRGAFYYPWFTGGTAPYRGAWTQGTNPWTQYHPKRGYYDSASTTIIDQHIADLVYGKFNTMIVSWWGPGSREDNLISTILARLAASGTNLKLCLYYEMEGNTVAGTPGSPNPSTTQITSDLNYISAHYTSHPSYLHVNTKPVVFVYGGPDDEPTSVPLIQNRMAARWYNAVRATNEPWYTNLKVYGGYATDHATYPSDSWHQYGPATPVSVQGSYARTISPRFWRGDNAPPYLPEISRASWQQNIRDMLAGAQDWKLVTSYNEWGEGHAIEAATGPSSVDSGTNPNRVYSGSGWDSTSGYGWLLDDLAADGIGGTMAFVTAFNETFADLNRWVVLSAKNGSSNGFPGGPAQFGTDEIETVGDDPENLSYSAGNLRITPTLRPDGWHSARIETQRTFKPAAGSIMRIEASIQLPNVHGAQAAGYWPAFWTMGSWQRDDRWIWPACMEYDIGETVNGVNRNWSTVHGGPRSSWGGPFNEPEGYSNQGIAPAAGDLWGGFHIYAMEWDRTTATDTFRWYVDGVQTWTAQPAVISAEVWNNQTTQPGVFIILNVAMGGQFPAKMGGGPNTGTLPGVPMIVQYVRVSYNGSEAPEAAQGNNGIGGVGTVPPPPVIPPVPPPPPVPPTSDGRSPISTAAPTFTTGASYYTPDSSKTSLVAPLPTNSWFMNFMLGTGHEAVNMYPYDLKVTTQGLDICVPALNTSSSTSVLATMLQNFSFRATTASTTQKLTAFTDLSATVQWSNGMSSTIVRGMGYVTMNYAGVTPLVTSQNAIIAVNGTAVGATGTFTGTKFKFALNNGQTWLLYTSSSVTLTLSTANTLTASAAFSGTMRLALLPTATDEGVLDSSASCVPTGGTVSYSISGNTATETYTFTTTGSGTLLMYNMLHHQAWWTFPSAYAGPTIATLRGQMKAVLGPTWTLSIPLPTVSWDNANPIAPARAGAIATALAGDRSFIPVVSDPYFGGKQLAKAARLALISAQLGDTASRDLLLGNLKTVMNSYLQGTALRYDTVWGGIVSTPGLTNQDADFGNGRYNDHHFHYGYAIYAAAVIARYDAAWLTANQQRVNDLVRDIMNPSNADPYFTPFRHFDFFEAHSWAAGNFEFGDNRNQESTSEAVNAWYGVYLWGLQTAQTQIRDTARLLLAQEVFTAQKYWQILQSDTIYPAPFKQNGVVGILWSNKVDYATFFGAQAEYIHGIQMLPINPVSEILISKDWIREDWDNVLAALWTRSSVWRAEMVSGGSGYVPAQVSQSGQGFTNGLAASGGSGTGLVFNVNITGGQIVAPFIVFNQHGTGYTDGQIVTLNGSGGTGAQVRVYTQPEDGWKAVLLGGLSQVDPNTAWTMTQALTGFDDGSSKTQALVHIASQIVSAPNSLSGSAASTTTTTGNISLISGGKTLTGSARSVSTTTGNLQLVRSLTGAAASVSTTTGNLVLSKPNTLQGSARSLSLTTGTGLRIPLFLLTGQAVSTSLTRGLLVLESVLPPEPDVTVPPVPPFHPSTRPHQYLIGLIQSGPGHYKLTVDQLAEIFYRHQAGERYPALAVEFGLPQSVMQIYINRLLSATANDVIIPTDPVLVEDPAHPGLYLTAPANTVEDPAHPGLWPVVPTSRLTEDPAHPGLYLIT